MSGLQAEVHEEACADRLEELRESYEPYAIAISRHLALDLPDWLPDGDVLGTWRAAAERSAGDRLLPWGVAPDRLCLDRVYFGERFVNAAHRVVASPRGAGPERRGKFKIH